MPPTLKKLMEHKIIIIIIVIIIIITLFQDGSLFGMYASLTYGPQHDIDNWTNKLFTVCTEQVRSPYSKLAASGLPNPIPLEWEVPFVQAGNIAFSLSVWLCVTVFFYTSNYIWTMQARVLRCHTCIWIPYRIIAGPYFSFLKCLPGVMPLLKWDGNIASKISQKVFQLGPWYFVYWSRVRSTLPD